MIHGFDAMKHKFHIVDDAGSTLIIPPYLVGKKLFICKLEDMIAIEEIDDEDQQD
jgi:hypothetical protein